MSSPANSQPIRLLHLSDIHFSKGRSWDADPILRHLAKRISDDVAAGLVPDLVVCTGDLAFSGQQHEYKLAKSWLESQLWPALMPDSAPALYRDRLLLVPGNHDVDRKRVDAVAEMVQTGLLAGGDQQRIAAVLGDASQRETLLKRHAAYLGFYTAWLGTKQTLPWWQCILTINDQRLHIAGLDSAWMSCGDNDRNQLLLGSWQLKQTVDVAEATDADWKIALLHHPWDYLAEFDAREAQRACHQHRDLILRGHLHDPEVQRTLSPDPDYHCLEIAAGCVYEHASYPNAFQWIELHAEPRRVRVLHRIWLGGKWQPDCNLYRVDQDGAVEIPLGDSGDDRTRHQPPKAPSVPDAYRAWLRRTYSDVELLGQDAQQGQAIQLRQVYVPALTAADAAEQLDKQTKSRSAMDDQASAMDDQASEGKRTAENVAPAVDQALAMDDQASKPSLLLERLNRQSLYAPAPPGGGKTTFCRWALLQAIADGPLDHPVPAPKGYAEPPADDLRRRLPLLLLLRDFADRTPWAAGRRSACRIELEQALVDWIDRAPPDGLDGALFQAHLNQGSAFLLLDGLDEVPITVQRDGQNCHPREQLLSALADALPIWQQAGNRILLTSRPYGLDPSGLARLGLPSAALEPLPRKLQTLFIQRWFHTLDKPALGAGLQASLSHRDDLDPLTENPLLLTALCVIYGNGRRLPEDRYHLYQRIVDNVLHNRYPGDARSREPIKARLEAVALGMHLGLDAERGTPAAEVADVEIEGLLARFAEVSPAYASGRIEPALQREELQTRSGLLLPRTGNRSAFYHLSLQEFLAAERLARTSDERAALEQQFRRWDSVPEWRPTLLFLFAAQVFNYRDAQWGLDLLTRLTADLRRAEVKANPAPAVLVAEALELCLAKGYRLPTTLAEDFRGICLAAIDDEIAVKERHRLGLCLGLLGDPRIKDLQDPDAYVQVPAGDYVYGDDNQPLRIDVPFRLSRYPVTNSQYRAFIEAGGYLEQAYWSDAGWAWLQQTGVIQPVYWDERRWNGPSQPVVGVSSWEAEACCRWAGGRLPTEQEWEAAARCPDGCTYPWGDDWEDGICNSDETGLDETSTVGLFPRSHQRELGITDMAGNVWEWCDSYYEDRGDRDGVGVSRVLRGGAFIDSSRNLRCSYRFRYASEIRYRNIGFRCVLAPRRQH
jgi:predicted phosphodiesterase